MKLSVNAIPISYHFKKAGDSSSLDYGALMLWCETCTSVKWGHKELTTTVLSASVNRLYDVGKTGCISTNLSSSMLGT